MAKEYDWGQDFPIKYRLKAKKSKSKKASKKENKENNRPGITDYQFKEDYKEKQINLQIAQEMCNQFNEITNSQSISDLA